MRALGLGRYLAEWAGVFLALVLLGEVLGPVLCKDGHRAAVVAGVLVTGVADLVVYALVAHGLLVDPARFMQLWGLSVLGKLMFFGSAAAVVIGLHLAPGKPFLLVLGAAFPVFTAHQVFSLVRSADRKGAEGDGPVP